MSGLPKFSCIEEITSFINEAYADQRGSYPRAPRLALAVAKPDILIEEAVRLSGADGMSNADLRRAMGRLSQERFDRAIWHLSEAGVIVRSKERRRDRAGRRRELVVWRLAQPRSGSKSGARARTTGAVSREGPRNRR